MDFSLRKKVENTLLAYRLYKYPPDNDYKNSFGALFNAF